jgi:ADP-heptose:LPS heptosyltransferase
MFMVTKVAIFIGNVSGPGHIAGVLGVPTLLVFAGQVTPYEWHPLGQKTMNIRMGIPCAPCYKAFPEQCPYDLKCLKFLWPEKVLSAVEQLLTISGSNIKKTYI